MGGVDWIAVLKSGTIAKLAGGTTLQTGLFDDRNPISLMRADYPGERLVVCRDPALASRSGRQAPDRSGTSIPYTERCSSPPALDPASAGKRRESVHFPQ